MEIKNTLDKKFRLWLLNQPESQEIVTISQYREIFGSCAGWSQQVRKNKKVTDKAFGRFIQTMK